MKAGLPLSPPAHLAHLDGLRACLALYVVLCHAWFTIWPDVEHMSALHGAAFYTFPLSWGRLAVDWFIVLSGYCLTLPAVRDGGVRTVDAGRFYIRRARRILPTFYLALLLSVLLALGPLGRLTGTHWDISLPVTPSAVLANVVMVQDAFEVYKINHAFWSIAVEWRIYFLFPLVIWAFSRHGPPRVVAVALVCTVAIAVASPYLRMSRLQTSVSYFGLFLLGALAATRRPSNGRVAIAVAWTATVIVLWQQTRWHLPPVLAMLPLQDLACGIAASAWLVHWATPSSTRSRRVLQWTPLPAIGTFAYSLYLTHAPLVQLCWLGWIEPFGLVGGPALVVLVCTCVPLTVAAAFAFFWIAERPFLSRRQTLSVSQEVGQGVVRSG